MNKEYLPGLNSLRFFAAAFVIASHASINSFYKFNKESITALNRGGDAVEFFFTLSGFLITYLLLKELDRAGTISISQFYLRRIFRIWPLYFLITAAGFLLFYFVYPILYGTNYFNFPLSTGIICFILFIPNYITSNFAAGLLNPLWSIGVEEQFYLFWAPLLKLFRRIVPFAIFAFALLATLFYYLNDQQLLPFSNNLYKFFLTQKFYAMAIGSFFGYLAARWGAKYDQSFLSNKAIQLLVICLLFTYYFFNFWWSSFFLTHIVLIFLYSLLIVNVSVSKRNVINLEYRPLVYLGSISYGLYMYHMLVDYLLRMVFPRLHVTPVVLIPLYYILLFMITIAISMFSYKYFEGFFLKKGKAIN